MMDIINKTKYEQYYKERVTGNHSIVYGLLLSILLFGSMGAITWGIRGSAGWGGVDGTVLPGIMWGLLWYYLAYRNGLDGRGVILWLGLGIALGGELGYSQYVSWIRGILLVGEAKTIEPWLGYLWFTLCGIGWAAPGGILLGWALGERVSVRYWIIRSIMLVPLLIILFVWPVVDWLSEYLLLINSGILFPNIEQGLLITGLTKYQGQTLYTNTQTITVVIWWLGALLIAVLQRDKTTLITGLIIGGGFGLGFLQSALWCYGYGFAPNYIDWWKVWELNAGFNLGLLYAVTFYWAIRRKDKTYNTSSKTVENEERSILVEWRETLFLSFGGSLLIFFVGYEYFFWTGLVLSLFYFVSMCFTTVGDLDSYYIAERRKNVLLIFSIFFLLFLMFHDGSYSLGVILEIYSTDTVSQYDWPLERYLLFAPVALVLISVAVFKMRQVLQIDDEKTYLNNIPTLQPERMIDLMTVMGFIGALSIWPGKVGVLYALFIALAIFAFNRLERQFKIRDIS